MLAEGTLPSDGRADGSAADSRPSPASNLSLKEGEKIKITLGGKVKHKEWGFARFDT